MTKLQRESLAIKFLEIGKTILRSVRDTDASSEKIHCQNGIKWLQKAFSVVELCTEPDKGPVYDLKVQ